MRCTKTGRILRRRFIRRVTSLPIVYPQGYCVRRRRVGEERFLSLPISLSFLKFKMTFKLSTSKYGALARQNITVLRAKIKGWSISDYGDTQANFKRGLPQASHLIKKTLPMIMASFVHQKYIIMDKKLSLNMWNSTNHIKTLLDTFQRLVKFSFVFCEVSPLILWPGIKT